MYSLSSCAQLPACRNRLAAKDCPYVWQQALCERLRLTPVSVAAGPFSCGEHAQDLSLVSLADKNELEHHKSSLRQATMFPIHQLAPVEQVDQLDPAHTHLWPSRVCTQPSTDESHNAALPQASHSQASTSGCSQEPLSKPVGPWVVSNRKVQQRYRQKKKVRRSCKDAAGVAIAATFALQAERDSMEQQLETLTAQLDSMKARNLAIDGQICSLAKAVAFKDREVANLQQTNHVSLHLFTSAARCWCCSSLTLAERKSQESLLLVQADADITFTS